jgi:putative two-component system response regulator
MQEMATHEILIVDDDPNICNLVEEILKEEGYNCKKAGNANEAVDYLTEEEFSLVISDISMPGKTGLELLGFIKETYPDLAVIMLTGLDDRRTGTLALQSGAFAYLIKPFSKNELLINVENAIRQSELKSTNRRYTIELERLVKERTQHLVFAEQEIKESQEETIHRLANAAEFRDNETAEHTKRMAYYCSTLAGNLNRPKEFCDQIRMAAPLHDVGKIGISDTILLKPGKLTTQEFEIIKPHAAIGYRILDGSHSTLLKLGASIAITHHEKYDGTGYPNGLSGKDIPAEGRIAAICDVFDALTSDRVYKKAIDVHKAIDMMRNQSGCHFDPEYLNVFIDSMDEILVIKNRFAENFI